ncbi:MAG: alpha/beta hydrolase [Bacteroidota bacterium]
MKQERSEVTTPDHRKLFVQTWMPDQQPKAVIVMVHGLGEHIGRYDHWAERFVKHGIGFTGYDQQGHGRSGGKRGTPTRASVLVDDARLMVEQARADYPGIPVVMYGHSMGGNVAINYVISQTETVDALIVTSPWLKLASPPSKFMRTLASVLNTLAPGLTLDNGLDPAHISRVPAEVEAYANDPLVHPKISAGLYSTLDAAGQHALRNVYKINCPFLLMHGKGDKITSWKASEEFVMNTSEHTRLKLWEGAYHELHHEPEREEVFQYILDWMKEYRLA